MTGVQTCALPISPACNVSGRSTKTQTAAKRELFASKILQNLRFAQLDFYLFFHLTLPTGGQGGYPEGREEVRQWNMGGVRQSVHRHCLTPSGSKKCGAHPPKRPRIAKCKNLKIWILGIFNFGIFGSLRCGRHPLHGSPPLAREGTPENFKKKSTPQGGSRGRARDVACVKPLQSPSS